MSRNTYVREASSKMYSATVFALCQMLAEMPYSVLCAVGFYLLWYFPIGFQYEPSRAGFAFALVLITEIYSVTLGQAVAALSPSIIVAALFNPFLLVIFSLFCGVTIPSPNLTYFWRAWMYPLDPFTRLISGLVSTALHGLPVVCRSDEFTRFAAPAGQTCRQWAGEYADLVGGYLNNPDSTGVCEFCQYRVGDTFLAAVNISFSDRGRDLGIFVCYIIFNILVTLLAARFLSYAKR
jgi:ABC-type multidrug transport system permease subunit